MSQGGPTLPNCTSFNYHFAHSVIRNIVSNSLMHYMICINDFTGLESPSELVDKNWFCLSCVHVDDLNCFAGYGYSKSMHCCSLSFVS
jgi:hypothetical protein